MRKVFFLALLVVACAKKEQPAADTTAAPPPPPPPPPPAALTAADVAGTWNGTSKREGGGDTTTTAFTFKSTSDSTGSITFPKTKLTVDFHTKLDADSVISTSKPYSDPTLPKGTPKVVFRSVSHLKDGKMTGVATIALASKPDSAVAHSTWEATKAP